jgi:hypothetical protein
MDALSDMDAAQIRGVDYRRLRSTVEMLRTLDSEWVTGWIVEKLLSGALAEEWIAMADGISTSLRDELLYRATTENLSETRVPGVIPLLRRFGDRGVVQYLFRSLSELLPVFAESNPADVKKAQADLSRQIENLLREMPSALVIEGILMKWAAKQMLLR